jgi:hypothetical protein
MALHQGTIVWAVVADKNGHNAYGRPVVILTPEDQISGARRLVGVVASHTASMTNPRPETYIELPWHPTGRVGTKLKKPTVAVCEWLTTFDPSLLTESDVGGRVPALVLEKVLNVVRRMHGGQTSLET